MASRRLPACIFAPSKRTFAQPAAAAAVRQSSSRQTSSSSVSPLPLPYYALFPRSIPKGPPPNGPFAIDTLALKREFLALQTKYHPDRQSHSLPKGVAAAQSANINEAYATLLHPLRRAKYLLAARGVVEDESTTEDNQKLLMEVMEAREEVDEASSEDEFVSLKEANALRMAEVEKRLGAAFDRDDLAQARNEVIELGYWASLENKLKDSV